MGTSFSQWPLRDQTRLGCDLGYQKAVVLPCWVSSYHDPHLDVGPRSYFFAAICEFPFINKSLRILYSELSWNYLTLIPPISRVLHHYVKCIENRHLSDEQKRHQYPEALESPGSISVLSLCSVLMYQNHRYFPDKCIVCIFS